MRSSSYKPFEMSKERILSKSFIVNMIYSFQDRDYLYLILEYINGGDLR